MSSMNKFNKISRNTTAIVFLLVIMSIICWIVNQGILFNAESLQSQEEISRDLIGGILPYDVLIQCLAFVLIMVMAIWILVKLNGMRQFVAFDNTKRSGTIHLRTQILTVLTLAVLVFGTFAIFRINPKDNQFALAFSICAGIIGIVFSDIIKSITAYTHLSTNGHIHIGDWISIPKQGVDGLVKSVSMLSVTVNNWDNSISTIPTYTLLNEHLQNFQRILDVADVGRKMCKTFIIDTSSIHTMTENDVVVLKEKLQALSQDTITLDEIQYPTINLQLYRKFIHHWLKNRKDVTHNPRLLASIQEPEPEGVPLQLYVFLLKSSREAFELLQSEITEFVIMSMDWFGLRLYQRPSDYQIARLSTSHNENN